MAIHPVFKNLDSNFKKDPAYLTRLRTTWVSNMADAVSERDYLDTMAHLGVKITGNHHAPRGGYLLRHIFDNAITFYS
jgi:hypothetical protein